jgi:hypothetical protein
MPVSNIIDSRTNKYNVNCAVILEESNHDNSIEGATQFEYGDSEDEIMYLGIANTTIEEAIYYVNKNIKSQVTLYLYDIGLNNSYTHDHINGNNLVE